MVGLVVMVVLVAPVPPTTPLLVPSPSAPPDPTVLTLITVWTPRQQQYGRTLRCTLQSYTGRLQHIAELWRSGGCRFEPQGAGGVRVLIVLAGVDSDTVNTEEEGRLGR
jgi:hypothetical protein